MLKSASLVFAAALSLLVPNAHAIEIGETAPCTRLLDVQLDGSELTHCINDRPAGTPFMILEFFSVTCGDCQRNLPIVSKLSGEIADTTFTREISVDRNEELIRNYLRDESPLIRFPVAMDLQREAKKAYGINYTPTVLVLDAHGKVLFKHVDTVLSDADVAAIKALVGH